jgi:hypothetical protein
MPKITPEISALGQDPDYEHGWDMEPPSAPPTIRGKSNSKAVELMTRWFFKNFEDPAHRTPRCDGEYVYVWGGPCNARDELERAFGGQTTDQALEAAASQIEEEGYDWVPSGNRMCPEPTK